MTQARKNRSGEQRWQVAAVCLVLAAITFAVFGQTTGFGFLNFDDNVYVYQNPVVAGGLSMKGFVWVFTHMDCNFYHPLTMLSLMTDCQIYGLHAGGYHFTNVLLHAASVILLFLVLRQMTGALWRSAFVAAVFAIHPLRAESVAWVAERKDVLGAFFFMLTLGAYVRYARKPDSKVRYLLVAVAFVMALLSKPTMVTLPFVMLLLDYWPLQRMEPRTLSRLVMEKIPLLVLAIGASALTVLAEATTIAANANTSMPSRIANALVSCVIYLRQMVWPEGLAAFYPQPKAGYPVWIIALSLLLLTLITGGVLVLRRKRPWLLTGWLWYLGMLAPMTGIIQVGWFAYADRMTYLPQIGVCVAVTWLVAEWRMSRVATGSLMAGVIGVLMVCAWRQTAYWKDGETLWTHALACTTDNYVAHFNLGNDFRQAAKLDDAIAQFQQALQIKPNYAEAHDNLGNAFRQEGRMDEAIIQYQSALQINPDNAKAHNNLGYILLQKGRVDEAIPQFQQALQINPGDTVARANLEQALLQKGGVNQKLLPLQH